MSPFAATLSLGFLSLPVQASVVQLEGPWTPVAVVLLSAGLVGMGLSDWIWGGSTEPGDLDDEPADDVDDLFGGGGDNVLDDLDGDEGGDDDWGDEFDEDAGLDDGLGEEPPTDDDLQPRLEELEDDVDRLVGTMEQVEEHNEAIGESVEDVEETVGKLLEIYEMVTQGVNPFVEEVEEGEAPDEGFGLFDGEADDGGDLDDIDIFDADPVDHDEAEDQPGDGVTFDELKAEYDEDPLDWDEAPEEPASAHLDGGVDADGDLGAGRTADGGSDTAEDDAEWLPGDAETGTDVPGAPAHEDHGPYLETLPHGYVHELVVLEWLGALLERGSLQDARRALRFYADLGWLGDDARRELETVLVGLDDGQPAAAATDGGGPRGLTYRDHVESLEYVAELAGGEQATMLAGFTWSS